MSAIYKIIGEDGQEYGPATAEQITKWIAEKRVECETPIFVDGAKDWTFVGRLPEFANLFSGNPAVIKPLSDVQLRPKTNGFATASLVCGILSVTLLCCFGGIPFNILGFIFSVIALLQIGNRPEVYTGRGLAIAGLILSSIGILFLLVMLMSGHTNLSFNFPQILNQ
jgi:hypothetical protein